MVVQYITIMCFILLAFFMGSIPTALIMGRLKGLDIRQHGSGNVGATNAFRVLGRTWGLACLAIDIFKGWLPAIFPLADMLALPGSIDTWQWIFGLVAICGHMFSPWLKFRGGKGVATSLGVLLAIQLWPMLITLAVAALVIWLSGYISLASITGAALLPMVVFVRALIFFPGAMPWPSIVITVLLGAAVIWKHRGNLERLRNGTERPLFGGPSPADGPVPDGPTDGPNAPPDEGRRVPTVEVEVED